MEDKLNELSLVNALLFGVLFAASYYMFFYHPSNPKVVIEGLDQNISVVKGEIAKLDKVIREGEELLSEIETIEKKAEKVYKYIPESFLLEEASSLISEEARLAGLSIQAISSQGSWSDKETISVGSVNVTVQGPFNKIMVFLSELTRKDRIYIVRDLEIREGGASNQQTNDLNLIAKVDFFRRYYKKEEPGRR